MAGSRDRVFNPFTGEFDEIKATVWLDGRYVNIVGDTMRGALTIIPSSGEDALKANGHIKLQAGKKLIFDAP